MKIPYAHILIVAGDAGQAAALSEPLQQQAGWYAVTVVSQAAQALSALASHAFDLILVDVEIAAAHDFAFLHTLPAYSSLNQVSVMVLGNGEQSGLLADCLAEGATDFLIQPAHPVLLKACVNSTLQRKQLQEQAASPLAAFHEMKKLADDLRNVILPLGVALSTEPDFDRLLERFVLQAQEICHADAGTVYLRSADDHLHYAVTRINSLNIAYGGTTGQAVPYAPLPLTDPLTGAANQRHVVTHVALAGRSVNIANVYSETDFDFSDTRAFDQKNKYHSVSCLTVPIKNEQMAGVLQLLNARDPETEQVTPFSLYHQLVAESLASQIAVVLHNHRLRQRQEALLRYERELQLGRQIQRGFFPDSLMQPPGWEVVARFHSAREVAGDFYDVIPLPHQKLGLVVADVCDKGIVAALFMALARSLLRAFIMQHYYLLNHERPAAGGANASQRAAGFRPVDATALLDTVQLTNAYLGSNHGQTHMFVTLFLAVLDPQTGHLAYINGGHNPPIILNQAGELRRLPPTGPAVGLRADAQYRLETTTLQPGDMLLAYTDGVTEARSASGEWFTEARLSAMMPAFSHSAAALLDQIDAAVQQHIAGSELSDDITMLAVRRKIEDEEEGTG